MSDRGFNNRPHWQEAISLINFKSQMIHVYKFDFDLLLDFDKKKGNNVFESKP